MNIWVLKLDERDYKTIIVNVIIVYYIRFFFTIYVKAIISHVLTEILISRTRIPLKVNILLLLSGCILLSAFEDKALNLSQFNEGRIFQKLI